MEKFERWSKKLVSPEEDGAGEYSGAGKDAFAYKRTAGGLCQAALLVDEGMLALARQWAAPADVSDAEEMFPRLTLFVEGVSGRAG